MAGREGGGWGWEDGRESGGRGRYLINSGL